MGLDAQQNGPNSLLRESDSSHGLISINNDNSEFEYEYSSCPWLKLSFGGVERPIYSLFEPIEYIEMEITTLKER